MTEQKKVHYIDKKILYDDLCVWKVAADKAAAEGKKAPPLPDSIGKQIILLADRMASRPNFRGYTYNEEMRGDGIVAAVRAANKFDPDRLNAAGEHNPFGFLSLVIWRSFLNRIKEEKKAQKAKMDSMLDPTTETYSRGNDDYDIDTSGAGQFMFENH